MKPLRVLYSAVLVLSLATAALFYGIGKYKCDTTAKIAKVITEGDFLVGNVIV